MGKCFLESGTDGLEITRMWLKRNYDKLLAEEAHCEEQDSAASQASATDSMPSTSSGSRGSKATPAAIMNEAYMETLSWDENNIYPEVWEFML